MLEPVKPVLPLAALLGALTLSFAARAQTAAPADPAPASEPPASEPPAINLTQQEPAQPQQPTIDLAVPPPAPLVERQFQQHEGFYARVNVGLGTLLSATLDPDVGGEAETGGLTLNYDLLIGGSPSAGFTIGGGVLGALQLSGDWEVGGAELDGGDMTTLLIGPFVDAYPQPKGGLHFGGLVGLGHVSLETPGAGDSESALGFGGAVWGGHDVWVAPEWSVGGQLRLDVLRASASDPDFTVTNIGLTLSFSVVYN